MKTIEVTDELYEQLLSISNEMRNQDNRATALPQIFQIRTWEKTPAWFEGEHVMYVDQEGQEYETLEEFKQLFEDNELDLPHGFDDLYKNKLDDLVDDYFPELHRLEYNLTEKLDNAFFTEKACKIHILKNHYHYNDPDDYLSHCFRNPELELIQRFLLSLTENNHEKR